jgi:hypothetical protein
MQEVNCNTAEVLMIENFKFDDSILHSVMAAVSQIQPTDIFPEKETSSVDWNLPGFGGKVRVGTTFGDLPIEALRLRDTIRTINGGTVRVQWIDKVHLDDDFVFNHPSARPIRIAPNAFGAGKPMHEMIVSPAQELCADAHMALRFRLAKGLSSHFNAHKLPSAGLTYYRFHCGEPVVVQMEGVWVKVRP